MEGLAQVLDEHMRDNAADFETVNNQIYDLRDKHIARIRDLMEDMKVDVSAMKSDIGWLRYITLGALGASLTGVVQIVMGIIRR